MFFFHVFGKPRKTWGSWFYPILTTVHFFCEMGGGEKTTTDSIPRYGIEDWENLIKLHGKTPWDNHWFSLINHYFWGGDVRGGGVG